MSKAEKFISDCTRNCSNEILSPYPQIINDVRRIGGEPSKEFSPWLALEDARKAVEIARKEMMEQTLDFLKDRLYKNGYIGIIDLCDEYIKTIGNE